MMLKQYHSKFLQDFRHKTFVVIELFSQALLSLNLGANNSTLNERKSFILNSKGWNNLPKISPDLPRASVGKVQNMIMILYRISNRSI